MVKFFLSAICVTSAIMPGTGTTCRFESNQKFGIKLVKKMLKNITFYALKMGINKFVICTQKFFDSLKKLWDRLDL